jgi:hypothetical protein
LWLVSVELAVPRLLSCAVVEELSPPYTPAVEPAAPSGSGLAANAAAGNIIVARIAGARIATAVIFISEPPLLLA